MQEETKQPYEKTQKPSNTPSFLREKHTAYLLSLEQSKDLDSIGYYLTEHLKMGGAYWSLAALSCLKVTLTPQQRDPLVSWLKSCQNPDGGFGGNAGHDSHITSTHYAVLVHILLDSLETLDKNKVVDYISRLQNDDGSFNGDIWGEKDTRFSYCALSSLALLGFMDKINVSKACEYVLRCRNFDGAFGGLPDMESHAAYVFCCVGALRIGGALPLIDKDSLAYWLSERQTIKGGFNGRPEKLPDVCYSWWVYSSFLMIEKDGLFDKKGLEDYIMSCQDKEGGISDKPGNCVDVFHTFFGLAALSMLDKGMGLEEIDPTYAVPKRILKEKFKGLVGKFFEICCCFFKNLNFMEKFTEVLMLDCQKSEDFDSEMRYIRVFNGKIDEFLVVGNNAIFISEKGETFRIINWGEKIDQNHQSLPINELTPFKIRSLSCNSTVIHAITDNGMVFSWGRDEDFTGVLGLGRVFSQKNPVLNHGFNNERIISLNIGEKHAGAIDANGRVYLWGTGISGELGDATLKTIWEPKEYNNQEIENSAISLDCQRNCTTILTNSGNLYILGNLNRKGFRGNRSYFRVNSKTFKEVAVIDKFVIALNSRGQLVFINKKFEILKYESSEKVLGFSKSRKTLIIETENSQFYFWKFEDLKSMNKSLEFTSYNIRKLQRKLNFPAENFEIFTKSSENYHIISRIQIDHSFNSSQPLTSKPITNPKLVQIKHEIDQIFSKSTPKPNNFASLLNSLDNSFTKKREQRKNDQLKTQKKLAIISQELKKFNDKPLSISTRPQNFSSAQNLQNLRPIILERENSNSKQNFQNFSFAKETSEKPLDFFLNLINSQRSSDFFTVKQSIYLRESSQPNNLNPEKSQVFSKLIDQSEDNKSQVLINHRVSSPDSSSHMGLNLNPIDQIHDYDDQESEEPQIRVQQPKNQHNFFQNNEKEDNNLIYSQKKAYNSKVSFINKKSENHQIYNFQTRAKTPETSRGIEFQVKRTDISPVDPYRLLTKRPTFDFRCFSSHQKLARPSTARADFSELSRKLGKRMFTFGLDYELDKRKNSHFFETKISELNLSSERTGVMSTRAENTVEIERNGKKSSLLERTGALSTKAENTTLEMENRYKGSILDIARKISGNLEELVGRLGRPEEGIEGKNEENYERNDEVYQKNEELEQQLARNEDYCRKIEQKSRNQCLLSLLKASFLKRKLEVFFILREHNLIIGTCRRNLRKTVAFVKILSGKLRNCQKRIKFEAFSFIKNGLKMNLEKKKQILMRICKILDKNNKTHVFGLWYRKLHVFRENKRNLMFLGFLLRKMQITQAFRNLMKFSQNCRKLSRFSIILTENDIIKKKRLALEKIQRFCAFKVKQEKLATLKTLGFNKLLFILFEIFNRKIKTAFTEIKRKESTLIKSHQKKTSLRDIMYTMETLAEHQRSLGLNSTKAKAKFSGIQIECLIHVLTKIGCKRKDWSLQKMKNLKTCKKNIRNLKENMPRKVDPNPRNVKNTGEIENILLNPNTNNGLSYFEINKRKNRQKSNEKTINLNNSGQEAINKEEINQSFGNISKIMLNNSNDSDLSLFNLKKSSQLIGRPLSTKEKERQINSKKLQNQLKLLSSDFHDPKEQNLLFSENIKEDFKNFGLADPHELQETSTKPQPPLILQDLNCDLISPKISEKQRKNLEKNYCSLVQYKSVSPKKTENNRDFEAYLKDFKEPKLDSPFVKASDFTNKENTIITETHSRNNESLSKYSSNSTSNNYKRVIENQKRFIGNFHKQVYNTISGRIASPSYQDYVNERKKN